MRPRSQIDPAALVDGVRSLPGLDEMRHAAAGRPAYLVGGAVRDLLLGLPVADIDVAVSGDAAAVARALGSAATVHDRFGTATVRIADGHAVDLAATRRETYPAPGALPVVEPAGIDEDLARRDFTINAMAVPLEAPDQLLDPFGGLGDLAAGTLRLLHGSSVADDPTRTLRGSRYAARLDLEPAPDTEAQLRGTDLTTVSDDRRREELRRVAAESRPGACLALLATWGVLKLGADIPAIANSVAELASTPPWGELANPFEAVVAVAEGRMGAAPALAAERPESPSAAARLTAGRSGTELLLARALGAHWPQEWAERWRLVSLEIDGDDLLRAGVPEGPAIGRGLQAALEAKLDGSVQGREAELRTALEAAGNPAR
ncbi:MAG: hypothetical protein ACR2NA_14445 [Solirubrobacterales bacterium]